jgi:16S rRNA (cytosine1402-N4)-methyltransferase
VDEPKKKKRPYHRKRRIKVPRSTAPGEHVSVLPAEVLEALNPQDGQVMVDCTLGFAGHAADLLEHLGPTGRLIAFDLDGTNLPHAQNLLTEVGHPFTLHHGNFAGVANVLAAEGIVGVDGLLADLGMSSMQLDDRERGFSMMRDGPLDMRMDATRGRTAAELLATMSVEELTAAFTVESREATPFTSTVQLRDFIELAAPVDVKIGPGFLPPRKQRLLPATRVFQALRILVNRELANLQSLLRVLPYVLNPGGTAAIISFHSGEDRLVKNFFRDGLRMGVFAEISDNAVRPSEEEKLANPRARSAKLRWARMPEAS